MNRIAPHRKLFGVVILAIYAFITLPVQAWHNHALPKSNPAVVIQKANTGDIFLLSEDSGEGFCGICSHHYSAYSNNSHFIIAEIGNEIHLPADFFSCSIPDSTLPGSCNKGPPAIC